MCKYLVTSLILTLCSLTVFGSSVGCSNSNYRGNRIDFSAQGSLLNTRNGTGNILINGRVVARFTGRDLNMNPINKSFSATNNQGASVSGRILEGNQGVINRLVIRGTAHNYTNIPVTCVAKR
jgi:hypothetical protein